MTCKEKIKIADAPQDILLPGIPPQISSTLEQMLPAVESKSSDDSWLGISSCHCLSPHCSEELISLLKAIKSFLNPAHSYSFYFGSMKESTANTTQTEENFLYTLAKEFAALEFKMYTKGDKAW